MEISILDLKNGLVKEKEIEDSIFLDKEEFDHEVLENPKFDVNVHLRRDYSGILLSMRYSGELKFTCDRCLSPSELMVEDEFSTNLLEEIEEELGSIFIDENTISIDKLLYDEVYVSLPVSLVCSEDCRGICSDCATNLNVDECKCKDEYIDPRLMKLKSLLK